MLNVHGGAFLKFCFNRRCPRQHILSAAKWIHITETSLPWDAKRK